MTCCLFSSSLQFVRYMLIALICLSCFCLPFYVCVCVDACVFLCAVSGWLCVCGQSGGTLPLHLRDSFHLPGALTGKVTSSSSHTRPPTPSKHAHPHTRSCTTDVPIKISVFQPQFVVNLHLPIVMLAISLILQELRYKKRFSERAHPS